MPKIGLIDDKKDLRESTRKLIQNHLGKKYKAWGCVDTYPFKDDLSQYVVWIGEHDIAVLVIDEQLQEEPATEGWNVDYNAHNLIDFIRGVYPTFPVFAMTAYRVTDELKAKNGAFDDILEKEAFSEDSEGFTDRFVRAGQRFTDVNQEELDKLSEISRALAEGKEVDDTAIAQAKAIQERLGIPFTIDGIMNRSEALHEFDRQLNELEKTTMEIRKSLGKK